MQTREAPSPHRPEEETKPSFCVSYTEGLSNILEQYENVIETAKGIIQGPAQFIHEHLRRIKVHLEITIKFGVRKDPDRDTFSTLPWKGVKGVKEAIRNGTFPIEIFFPRPEPLSKRKTPWELGFLHEILHILRHFSRVYLGIKTQEGLQTDQGTDWPDQIPRYPYETARKESSEEKPWKEHVEAVGQLIKYILQQDIDSQRPPLEIQEIIEQALNHLQREEKRERRRNTHQELQEFFKENFNSLIKILESHKGAHEMASLPQEPPQAIKAAAVISALMSLGHLTVEEAYRLIYPPEGQVQDTILKEIRQYFRELYLQWLNLYSNYYKSLHSQNS